MGLVECPLCCAEVFPDLISLESHLLDLSDNIICPICEDQFSTIRSLAHHLGQGCKNGVVGDDSTLMSISTSSENLNNDVLRHGSNLICFNEDEGRTSEFVFPHELSLEQCKSQSEISVNPKTSQDKDDSSKSTEALYSCSVCNITFTSVEDHLNKFHLDEKVIVHSEPNDYHKIVGSLPGCLSCSECPAKLQTSSHLERHLAMHRKNDLVKCEVCDSMVQKSSYQKHKLAHEKDGVLSSVCLTCNRHFKGNFELNLHIPQCHLQRKEEENLTCPVCKKCFTELDMLREHMVSHNIPIKQHLCYFCPKSYKRLIDKVIHERIHTKSKPHCCCKCGKCFRLRSALIAHSRIHTGEKPFNCSSCGKLFRTKNLLRSHFAVHSEKQYKCKHCNKIFRSQATLEGHEKFHKKPITCKECKRSFYSLAFAQKHMSHHEKRELKFTCNMCPNMFTSAANLESHLKLQHDLDTLTSISITTEKTYQDMEKSTFGT